MSQVTPSSLTAIEERVPSGSVSVTRHGVVICYSLRDRDIVGDLQVQLKPLQRAWLLDFWDGERAGTGARARDVLAEALARARLTVVLTSPGLATSSLMGEHRLPTLLSRQVAAGSRVMCLHTRPTASVFREYPYRDRQGARHRVSLAGFEDLNDPRVPVAGLDHVRRQTTIAAAGAMILQASHPDLVAVV